MGRSTNEYFGSDLFDTAIGSDTDGDGIPNSVDLDSDNDGLPDRLNASTGTTDVSETELGSVFNDARCSFTL